MKRIYKIGIAVMIAIIAISLAGCSLLMSSTDSIANGGSSSSGATVTQTKTYKEMTRSELEAALSEYYDIANTLSERVDSLESAVRDAIGQSKANIGAYAVTYVDSVMSLLCVDERYVSASTNSTLGCQGTGFIISKDGYVITNNHVIAYENEAVWDTTKTYRDFFGRGFYSTTTVSGEYQSITAVFDSTSKYYNDGENYSLEFVYRDPNYDLALCKLVKSAPVGNGWSAIPFFEGTVSRGDELLVLGNAYGFGLSATSGLISATNKFLSDSPKLTFIQTDAAINGGNSGGPATNIYGGLVGVVNSKFVSSQIENMGFAIELDKLKTFISDAQTSPDVAVSYTVKVNYQTVSAEANSLKEAA